MRTCRCRVSMTVPVRLHCNAWKAVCDVTCRVILFVLCRCSNLVRRKVLIRSELCVLLNPRKRIVSRVVKRSGRVSWLALVRLLWMWMAVLRKLSGFSVCVRGVGSRELTYGSPCCVNLHGWNAWKRGMTRVLG